MQIIASQPAAGKLRAYSHLGETRTEVNVDTAEDNRTAAISLARQARQRINIFTQDLDSRIYDNIEFERSIFDLATRHPTSEIRILVKDSSRAVQQSHSLIKLAQKLTSSIFIRKPADEFKAVSNAFMTVDDAGMIHRVRGDQYNYEAAINYMTPQRVRKLNTFFNEVWEGAQPDAQVRQLFI